VTRSRPGGAAWAFSTAMRAVRCRKVLPWLALKPALGAANVPSGSLKPVRWA